MHALCRFVSRFVLPPTALLICLGIADSIPNRDHKDSDVLVEAPQEFAEGKPLVGVVQPVRYSMPLTLRTHGDVVPFREVTLSADVLGEIVFVHRALQSGNQVNEGDILYRIDDRALKLEVQLLQSAISETRVDRLQAQKELIVTESKLKLVESRVAICQREYDRSRNLVHARVGSQSQVDKDHRALLNAREATLDLIAKTSSLESDIRRLQIVEERKCFERDKAFLALSKCTIVAPYSGTVVGVHAQLGSNVSVGDKLLTIDDTSRVEVACSLAASEIDRLYPGFQSQESLGEANHFYANLPKLRATIYFGKDGQRHEWTGNLSRCDGNGFDKKTRTLPCRITIDDPVNHRCAVIRRGMHVRVAIQLDGQTPMVALPTFAVQPGNQVWLAKDGHLAKIDVRVAEMTEQETIVFNDNQLGDHSQIVVSGIPNPTFGMPIGETRVVAWDSNTSSTTRNLVANWVAK